MSRSASTGPELVLGQRDHAHHAVVGARDEHLLAPGLNRPTEDENYEAETDRQREQQRLVKV